MSPTHPLWPLFSLRGSLRPVFLDLSVLLAAPSPLVLNPMHGLFPQSSWMIQKIKPFLFSLALTYLSAAQTIPMVSDRLYDDILCPLIFFGNVKAMPFPSVATGLTLARESWIFVERSGIVSSTNSLETSNSNRKMDFLINALFLCWILLRPFNWPFHSLVDFE